MDFNGVFKTGLRTQIRQRVPEIYHFSRRNPPKLDTFNVSKMKLFLHFMIFSDTLEIIMIKFLINERFSFFFFVLETLKVSSLWELRQEKWYILGTR
jgi:hypothetical protein